MVSPDALFTNLGAQIVALATQLGAATSFDSSPLGLGFAMHIPPDRAGGSDDVVQLFDRPS